MKWMFSKYFQMVVSQRKTLRVFIYVLDEDFLKLITFPKCCRAGGKNHECGTGRDELVECAKLGGLLILNILAALHKRTNTRDI